MSTLPLAAVVATMLMFGLVLTARSETDLVQIGDYTPLEAATATAVAAAPAAPPVPPPTVAPAPPAATPPAAPATVAPLVPAARSTGDRLAVMRGPSIDPATIRRVLRDYSSPAAGEAQAIYDLGVQYGVDPAVCLAFFIMESSAGTRGMAAETRSVGNIRATPGYVNHKGYRKYATWREGIEDWYRLISRLYVGEWGLTTVEAIVPIYAPAADSNDPPRYISTVRRLVREWSSK